MLAQFDENGVMVNDVIHLLTKEEPNPITMLDLLKLSLRLHPEILVPAEMRGKEALTVQEAGRTGHTIVSTLHANSARTAYERILTMCLEAGTSLSEERLLKNIVKPFPSCCLNAASRQIPKVYGNIRSHRSKER
jgi:pilus assembly protein CpaF